MWRGIIQSKENVATWTSAKLCCLLTGTSVDYNKENQLSPVDKKRTAFPGLCIPDQLTEDTSKVRVAVRNKSAWIQLDSCELCPGLNATTKITKIAKNRKVTRKTPKSRPQRSWRKLWILRNLLQLRKIAKLRKSWKMAKFREKQQSQDQRGLDENCEYYEIY